MLHSSSFAGLARCLVAVLPIIAVIQNLSAAEKTPSSQSPAAKSSNPFDGHSLAGWTNAAGKPVTDGWEVVDGVIHLKPGPKGKPAGGNILTAHDYGDFALDFEWKVAPKGNSGIKYRVRTYGKKVLGLEYQMYDDVGNKKSTTAKGSTASLYDLYEPNGAAQPKPAGQWNTGRIVVRGNRIEHWLNGEQVVVAYVGSSEWRKRIAESKFDDAEDFAENRVGKLMLTDHGSEVWIRNVQFQTFGGSGSRRPTLYQRLRSAVRRSATAIGYFPRSNTVVPPTTVRSTRSLRISASGQFK